MRCYFKINPYRRKPPNMADDDGTIGIFYVKDEARRLAINQTFNINLEHRHIGTVVRLTEFAGAPSYRGTGNSYTLYIGR